MAMATRRRFASFWAILEYLWNPLLGIMLTPVLLKALGEELFGYWALLFAAISLGAILNFGTGIAVVKRMAETDAANRSSRVRLLRSAMGITCVGAALTSLALGACIQYGGELIFPRMDRIDLLIYVGWCAALICFIEQLDNVLASALKGLERFSLAANLEMATRTVQFAAVAATALYFNALEPVSLAVVATSLLRLAAKSAVVARWFGASALLPGWTIDRPMLRLARWGWAQGVGGMFFGIADRLIVAAMLGPNSLAQYAVATQLTQQIHAISAAGTSVLLPQLSRRSKTESVSAIARAVSKLYALMICAIVLTAVLFAVFGRDILQLWLRLPVSTETVELFRYLTVAFAVLALNVVPHFVLLAVGHARLVATSNIAAGAISCVLMLWLTPLAGTDGVGYAKIAYGLITTAILVPVFVGLRFGK